MVGFGVPAGVMETSVDHRDRRSILRCIGAWSAGIVAAPLLAGCGDGDGASPSQGSKAAAIAPTASAPVLSADERRLNLALNLGYLGAQYYTLASGGAGLPPEMMTGLGRQGSAMGVRAVTFADPQIAAAAADIAADKRDQVAEIRRRLGTSAAAMPTLDLSAASTGAFSTVARSAGLVTSEPFDPYASEGNFLFGAFMLEDGVVAALRGLSAAAEPASANIVDYQLAPAIFHGGLVRMLADRQAAEDPAFANGLASLCNALGRLDGTDVGTQSIADDGTSANLSDAAGRPIPFLRSSQQALRSVYLSDGTSGGFLPYGANGLT
jgi:hypothetical protein